MFTLADIDARRAKAALKLELRAKKAEAARAEQAAREEDTRRRRAAHADRNRDRRAHAARAVSNAFVQWRPIAPIVLVTGCAMYGQVGYGFDHYSPEGTPAVGRLAVAVIVAVAVEYFALYVQWHAHDALLRKASSTAARLRYASYGLALAVAGVNYAHFAGPGLTPTPGAVVFALFSASGPWLWGLHTRRAQNLQLLREGRADTAGAVFSAERFRNFPIRTIKARRYSIDHGITDPQVAWEAYRLEMQRQQDDLPAAWRQLATSLLRLDVQQDTAEAATNLVSPIDVPELERVEDVVVPDLKQVDDNGLSKFWQTALAATTPPPAPKAARTVTPPKDVDLEKARELRANGAGRVQFEREFHLTEHQAKKLVKAVDSLTPSTNGHKVTQP